MAYFLDLFTPETWHAFCEMGATVTGFRDRQRRLALEHVHPGDIFLCYVTRVSRWSGVLQVESAPFKTIVRFMTILLPSQFDLRSSPSSYWSSKCPYPSTTTKFGIR